MVRSRGKAELRRRILTARSALGAQELADAAAAVSGYVLELPWDVVGAYVPVGSEPGSVALLDALVRRGSRVLLPVVAGTSLEWAWYDGGLVTGPWGLSEPDGSRVPLVVDGVLVPALACSRAGVRLGRGAGYYDRALAGVTVPRVALLHAGEFLDELPAEAHDVPMTGAITPAGFVALG